MQFTDAEPGEMGEVERVPGCKDMAISGPRATSGIEKVCQADRIAQYNRDQDENEPLMLEQDLKLELEMELKLETVHADTDVWQIVN
ncbi:GD11139 [Drosophila simulans]|uniref:GD11139 n=1 Tax=Drosophila simulans TaxID=7240 RepID=B4QGY7_DROSI|nr:GD11139 [Drosophila simulans]